MGGLTVTDRLNICMDEVVAIFEDKWIIAMAYE